MNQLKWTLPFFIQDTLKVETETPRSYDKSHSQLQPPINCDKVLHMYRGESVRFKLDDFKHDQHHLLKRGCWKADESLVSSYLEREERDTEGAEKSTKRLKAEVM